MIRMTMGGAAAIALLLASAAPAPGAPLGPGCAPDRPAIAHHAGGKVVAASPAPVPCTTKTGFYPGEPGTSVTPAGTVWFSAADWEWALARTKDLGAHWERFGVPGPQAYPGCGPDVSANSCDTSEQGKYNTVADAYVHTDRDTGRTFWTKTYGYAACSSLNYGDAGIMVAISHDEAASWTYSTVPTGDAGNGAGFVGGVPMAVDDAGTLYVVWPGTDKHVRLAVSRDQGKTWKGPIMAGPPGVTLGSPNPQIAARAPGHIATVSYGSTTDPQRLHGHLTQSFDPDNPDPLFYTATGNHPAHPPYFPTHGRTPPPTAS